MSQMDSPLPVAVVLVTLLILLDLAALRWGADSRDGAHPDPEGRFSTVIDPFFAEQVGRHKQAQFLAEAAHDRLIAEAKRARDLRLDGSGRSAHRLVRPLPALAPSACLRAAADFVGALLIAAGTRLQTQPPPEGSLQ